jgi:hypothetical protein
VKITLVAVLPLVAASSVAAAEGMAMPMPPASRPARCCTTSRSAKFRAEKRDGKAVVTELAPVC